jgi:hypothetical protein
LLIGRNGEENTNPCSPSTHYKTDQVILSPVEREFHQPIVAQAQQTPTAVVIEFEDQCIACFERGTPQILAILAVLKAGGAFPPLDPIDPTLGKEDGYH